MSDLKIDPKIADYVDHGFERIEDDGTVPHPPKISWGEGWLAMQDGEKIVYLEKLAHTMNHAASLMQDDRNRLGNLCELKEKQICQMKDALDQNNQMIQSEVTRANSERQQYNDAIKKLNAEIKELKLGND
ncbi:hypothetical protein [uncultured Mediterranean phage]|nr:hypothetical protein [uncultured Mediterranean phage]